MGIECSKCKGVLNVKEVNLNVQEIAIDGLKFKMTYYRCPLCKHKFTVMIDDAETSRVQRDYDSMVAKLQMHRRKGRLPTEYQVQKMFKLKEELKRLRNRLNKRYNMSFYQIGDVKERLELSLPVAKTGTEE